MSQKRFVIFAQPRSGSTLLQDLLHHHPDVHCDGELFNVDVGVDPPLQSRMLMRLAPVPYINRRASAINQPAYGFKLLLHQIPFPRVVLRRFLAQGWSVFHLKRTNVFAQAMSYSLAKLTGRWHRRQTELSGEKSFAIDPETFVSELKSRLRASRREAAILDGLPRFSIEYEQDLLGLDTRAKAISELHKILGVREVPSETVLQQTYQLPFEELVTNYGELVEIVRATSYSYLLPK
jgi:hypothetical protein